MVAPFRAHSAVAAAVSAARICLHARDTRATTGFRSMKWFSCVLLFHGASWMLGVHVRFRQSSLHFAHRDHRQEANEEQEKRKENSVGADKGPDVHPSGDEQAPRARQKITMQSADDDNETLEPHSGVDAHADEIDDVNVATAPTEPEELRRKRVAEKHSDPPVPPVRPEDAVPEREPFILISAIPGDEKFHRVGIGND